MGNENYKCFTCNKKFDQLKRVDNINMFILVCPYCESASYAKLLGLEEGKGYTVGSVDEMMEELEQGEIQEGMFQVLDEIFKERNRQNQMWGMENSDSFNTRNDWAAYISYYVNKGAYNGKDNLFTPDGFRKDLIKAAALCVAAVEAIDRNNGLPNTAIQEKENRVAEQRRAQEIKETQERRAKEKLVESERICEKVFGKVEEPKSCNYTTCVSPSYRMNHGCVSCAVFNKCDAKDGSERITICINPDRWAKVGCSSCQKRDNCQVKDDLV